jgi:two-component system, OmpR family, response regulator
MNILLAEDDPNISIIMQICLEKIGGHTVQVCEDGELALNAALKNQYDLILLDGMMPKRSGLQVAQELRKLNSHKGIPIIFLSAKSEDKDVNLFLTVGTGYIAKPFDPQSICIRIDEIMRKPEVQAQ